jgi:hypothetical protein
MFYTHQRPDAGSPPVRQPEIPIQFAVRDSKHLGAMQRLNGMQTPLRPIASTLARSVAMVAVAALLILVLLPAAVAAQAAVA